MYCRNCGKEINDTAAFCKYCGTKVTGQPQGGYEGANTEYNYQNDKPDRRRGNEREYKKGNKNKIIPLILGIVVGLAVLAVLWLTVFRKNGVQNSAENVATTYTKYMLENEVDNYYELLAPPYEAYMVGSQGWYDTADEFKETLQGWDEDYHKAVIRECGEDYKLNCSVKSITSCDESDLNSVRRELSRDYDYEADEIQDAAIVVVAADGSGSEGEIHWSYNDSCVKIDGKWYVHRPGFSSVG